MQNSIYPFLFSLHPLLFQGADTRTKAEDPIVLRALDRDRACIVVIVIVIVFDRATTMRGGFTVFISIVCKVCCGSNRSYWFILI